MQFAKDLVKVYTTRDIDDLQHCLERLCVRQRKDIVSNCDKRNSNWYAIIYHFPILTAFDFTRTFYFDLTRPLLFWPNRVGVGRRISLTGQGGLGRWIHSGGGATHSLVWFVSLVLYLHSYLQFTKIGTLHSALYTPLSKYTLKQKKKNNNNNK